VHAREPLQFAWAVTIPQQQGASTVGRTSESRRYQWYFELAIKLADSPDYRAKYPIVVRDVAPPMGSGFAS
jgi:hypothetical protein